MLLMIFVSSRAMRTGQRYRHKKKVVKTTDLTIYYLSRQVHKHSILICRLMAEMFFAESPFMVPHPDREVQAVSDTSFLLTHGALANLFCPAFQSSIANA